jgi:hypothetical protein
MDGLSIVVQHFHGLRKRHRLHHHCVEIRISLKFKNQSTAMAVSSSADIQEVPAQSSVGSSFSDSDSN